MKFLTKILLSLLIGATISYADVFSKYEEFRGTSAHITTNKTLTVGTNEFIVELKKNNNILDNVKVNMKAFMPAMPGMPAMSSKVKLTNIGNGKYRGKLNLAMNGTWQIHIFIIPKNGKKIRIKSSLTF